VLLTRSQDCSAIACVDRHYQRIDGRDCLVRGNEAVERGKQHNVVYRTVVGRERSHDTSACSSLRNCAACSSLTAM
jgi:hypothetical protein